MQSGGLTGTAGSGGRSGLGGLNGVGGIGGGGSAGGVAEIGGTFATGGSGGNTGVGGLAGSGGVVRTGGVVGTGGIGGTGGAVGGGGRSGAGGIGGTGGTAGGSGVFGMPCTTNQDCPSGAICCDGSSESCDGTRLPSGDGTNSGEFVISADSLTATDTITGLIWQRDDSSTGAETWAEAQAYCASLALGGVHGWRLPAWKELLTILDITTTGGPLTDQEVFSIESAEFWTCSSHPFGPDSGPVYVNFGQGFSQYCSALFAMGALCVSGSRCYPTSRFVALDGRLVRDTLTGLVWQQQPSITEMTWADAQSYCSSLGSGFRLPTLKEIDSIMDPTGSSGGPIDNTAFPNAPTGHYWTSSPYTDPLGILVGAMRFGDFSDDFSNECELAGTGVPVSATLLVRCVR